ncbi:MAG: methyl-accepting chemotaxis protein [Treponema sp.]|nr:methyl-accepting chemotaxis protein [Treponema sp.]
MNGKKMSLRTEVLLGTIGSMMIVALFLSISYMLLIKKIVQRSTVNSVSQTLVTLNEQIEKIFKPYENRVHDVAIAASAGADARVLDGFIHKATAVLNGADNDVYYATVVSRYEEGGFYIDGADWVPEPEWVPSSRDWWKDAVSNQGKITYGEPYVDAMQGILCITLSCAAYDDGGALVGVAAADIYLHSLSDAVKNIELSENSRIHVINKEGLYLTNDDPSFLMSKNYFDTAGFKSYSKHSYLDGTPKAFIEGDRFYGVHPIQGTDWFIVIEGPESDFSGEYFKMILYVFLGLVLLIILMIVIDAVLSNRVSRHFKELASGCEQIAKGDFSRRYQDFFTKEASMLANGFNLFSERLDGMIGTIKHSSSTLDVVSKNMKESVASVSDSMTSIRLGIGNVQEQVKSQSEGFDETSGVIQGVASSISTVNEMIDSQTRSIRESSSAVGKLVQSIEQISGSMETMARSFNLLDKEAQSGMSKQEKVNERISQIEQQSQMLQEANMAIASIAEQTNLLAMNAAIEAAHAGEAGKGFAVVADEIRKLSETSSGQSKTIGDQLKNIQDSIGEIVAASQESSEAFSGVSSRIHETDSLVQSVRTSLEGQNEDSRAVIASLASMDKTAENVRSSSRTMADGSRRVLAEMDKLRSSLEAVNESVSSMSDNAQSIVKNGMRLDKCVEELDSNVTQLGKDVDQFRTE